MNGPDNDAPPRCCRCWLPVLAAIALLIVGTWVGRHSWKDTGTTKVLPRQTLQVQAESREYRLVIPRLHDQAAPAPVLFAFHGQGEMPEQMAQYTKFDELAAEQGVFVVYPRGRHSSWPSNISDDNPTYLDCDLRFFDALLTYLVANYRIDPKRVYAVGMSQGGTFVVLLAANRGEKLAAIASHSGWLPEALMKRRVDAPQKCPALFLAGSDDATVPADRVKQAYEWFEAEGHEAQFCSLRGVGHEWGPAADVSQRIWRFFSIHARP